MTYNKSKEERQWKNRNLKKIDMNFPLEKFDQDLTTGQFLKYENKENPPTMRVSGFLFL